MMLLGLRVLLCAALILPAFVSLRAKKPTEPNPELTAITERGRLLAQYDAAAAKATDHVLAIKPQPGGTVRRYIGKQTADGWLVAFGRIADDGNSFLVGYEVDLTGINPQVKTNDPPVPEADFYFRAAKAFDTAIKSFKGTDWTYNLAILPADSDQFYVYIYPGQKEISVVPLGADARFLVSADGTRIVEKRQLHSSILLTRVDKVPKGGKSVGGVHSHVVSDVPEDTDILHVTRTKLPEYVGAGKHVYEIAADGTIKQTK